MKNLDFKRDILPHVIAIAVFYLVTIAFFSPIIFEGKELPQHDITMAEGGSKELKDYKKETGEIALWTNSMFSGMPTYLMGGEQFGDLMVHVHVAFGLWLPHPVRLLFIAFVCCYIMLVVFGVRPWLAIAGGLAFGFTDFSIIGLMAGHNAKVAAVAYMPLIFAGIGLAFQKKWLWGFVLTALAMALEIRANHLQITYYLLLIIVVFGISELIKAIKEGTVVQLSKTIGVLTAAVLVGVCCNLGRILTVMEYSKYSTRGKSELTTSGKDSGLDKDYAFQYSNGIMEPLFLFIPNFFGGSGQEDLGKNSNLEKALRKNGANRQQIKQQVENAPAYWGDQPLTAPYYAGAILVFLFVLSLLVLEANITRWMVVALVLGLMMSWGKNFAVFNEFLFDFLPGYNKFRSVTFTIIIPVFCMVLSGFMGLERLVSDGWNSQTRKNFFIAVGITGGFALLCVLFAGIGSYKGAIDERLASYPAWFLEALRADRASLLRMDALRTLFFVVSFASVLFFWLRNKLSASAAYVLMIGLVLVDMFGVSKRFINSDNFSRQKHAQFNPSAADEQIKKDQGHYRVLNLMNPFNDGITSYHHSSIGGYHGAKMGRYQDLIENVLSAEHSRVISSLQSGQFEFDNIPVLNMLNARYFKAGDEARAVIPNSGANGNAWFIEEVVEVNNADEEISALVNLNSKTTAVMDISRFEPVATEPDSTANIELLDYTPNKLTYRSSSVKQGLVVFSEIYYPQGWLATIDGKPADILRVNYVLRALEVPVGEHEIVFEFRPKSYALGNNVAYGFSILLIIGSLAMIGVSSYRKLI